MKDGYIRVASASIDTLIGNVKHNANEIKKVLKEKCPTVCISANDRKIQIRPAKVL